MTPKIRQTLYLLGTVATSVVTLLAVWRGIDSHTATALGNTITAVLGLLGVSATGVAGAVVAKQRSDGTLDFSGSPAEQAIAAIEAVNAQADTALTDRDRVQAAVTDLLGTIPVVGPLAQQVIDRAGR